MAITTSMSIISHCHAHYIDAVAKHWHVAGEVFAISDCLVKYAMHKS